MTCLPTAAEDLSQKCPHASTYPGIQVSNTLNLRISINCFHGAVSEKYQPLKPQEASTETILSYSQHTNVSMVTF